VKCTRVTRSSVLLLLLPCVLVAGAPISDQFGKVVDAATGNPVAGVRIVAIDSGSPALSLPPRVVEAVTDSLGRYSVSLEGASWVLYTAPQYQSVRMTYPVDLVACDSCCGRLKDVRLKLD